MRLALELSLVAALGVAACGDGGTSGATPETTTITVLAASSLTNAFSEVAEAFEAAHPGTAVILSFGASSSLREQILAGAPADVFASANESNMEAIVEAGEASAPAIFATNRLAIAVPAGNPAAVRGIGDFAEEDLLLGLRAPEVPCGEFARQALAHAGVTPALDTEAPDVRALLTQIESGDLDAGIVYETDLHAAGDAVERIGLSDEDNVVAAYPVAALTGAGDPGTAAAFVDFVLGDEGRAILTAHGFGAP